MNREDFIESISRMLVYLSDEDLKTVYEFVLAMTGP